MTAIVNPWEPRRSGAVDASMIYAYESSDETSGGASLADAGRTNWDGEVVLMDVRATVESAVLLDAARQAGHIAIGVTFGDGLSSVLLLSTLYER